MKRFELVGVKTHHISVRSLKSARRLVTGIAILSSVAFAGAIGVPQASADVPTPNLDFYSTNGPSFSTWDIFGEGIGDILTGILGPPILTPPGDSGGGGPFIGIGGGTNTGTDIGTTRPGGEFNLGDHTYTFDLGPLLGPGQNPWDDPNHGGITIGIR